MILDFNSYSINESSLKKLKKDVHGVLDMSARKRMRRELRDNIITFKFKKRNGDIRTAHGTLHPDYLPPLKGGGPRPERQMVYYDLDKEGWRSFRSYSFIKILNIKPVTSKPIVPKPSSKSAAASEDEEEVTKKTVHTEEEEVKKPIHSEKEEEVEEVEEKPSKKKGKDEDEEEHEYKSPIYDETKDEKKEREEDDEKVKELKHKHKKEDEDEDEEEKKEKTNESVSYTNELPNILTLGDGEYDGALWGNCFVYEGNKYMSDVGIMNIYPEYFRIVIKDGKVAEMKPMDVCQRPELKMLFQ